MIAHNIRCHPGGATPRSMLTYALGRSNSRYGAKWDALDIAPKKVGLVVHKVDLPPKNVVFMYYLLKESYIRRAGKPLLPLLEYNVQTTGLRLSRRRDKVLAAAATDASTATDRVRCKTFLFITRGSDRFNRATWRVEAMVPYVATTDDITVTVRPVYLDSQSDLMNRKFVFGYFIRIVNRSLDEVQLLRRHWLIRDADGRVEEVEGEGVIGEQPLIYAGDEHRYNSFCVLETFEGTMEGTYLMERANGERFKIAIPLFHLRAAAN